MQCSGNPFYVAARCDRLQEGKNVKVASARGGSMILSIGFRCEISRDQQHAHPTILKGQFRACLAHPRRSLSLVVAS